MPCLDPIQNFGSRPVTKEMAELAEQYNEAHGTYESQRSKFNIVEPESKSPSNKFTRPQLDRNQGTRDRYCYH